MTGSTSALVLGDNIFHGTGLTALMKKAQARRKGATVFGYACSGSSERFGVVAFDEQGAATSIEEKAQGAQVQLGGDRPLLL